MQFIRQPSDLIMFCPCFTSFIGCLFSSHIEFKIATLTFKVLKFQQPAYMFDLIAPYNPPRSHRSTNQNHLIVHDIRSELDTGCFPLLPLPFGTVFLNILVPRIHYLFLRVCSRPYYIKSLFHHSYQ